MKTIFVVDDNRTNLVVAKAALEHTYKTYTIPSAAKLFALAEKIRPDLILLDINMPECDGFQAMEMIKENPVLSSVPVVFLTAVSDSDAKNQGYKLGAVDFIQKPFSAPVLYERVSSILETDEPE